MPLSCSCDSGYEYGPGDWYYYFNPDPDFEPLNTSRRKRCCSCGELINIGSPCLSHSRVGSPHTEAEARINGYFDLDHSLEDEAPIKLADHYQCEKCGEIWLNLRSVGFECVSPGEDMTDLLGEYQREYKPPKLVA